MTTNLTIDLIFIEQCWYTQNKRNYLAIITVTNNLNLILDDFLVICLYRFVRFLAQPQQFNIWHFKEYCKKNCTGNRHHTNSSIKNDKCCGIDMQQIRRQSIEDDQKQGIHQIKRVSNFTKMVESVMCQGFSYEI